MTCFWCRPTDGETESTLAAAFVASEAERYLPGIGKGMRLALQRVAEKLARGEHLKPFDRMHLVLCACGCSMYVHEVMTERFKRGERGACQGCLCKKYVHDASKGANATRVRPSRARDRSP